MIAAKILGYFWIGGKQNPANIVGKHWIYPQVWHILKSLLFILVFNTDEKVKNGNDITLC
jgi:hypothetical protein